MSKQLTLIPCEVPPLELGLLQVKILGGGYALLALLRNIEGEGLVRQKAIGLGPVDRRVNFESDVEELSSKEVGSEMIVSFRCASKALMRSIGLLVWRENAS